MAEAHYRPDIDGLRTIAVGGVLLCHFKVELAAGGFAGVDVFFVISGYLITGLILADIERNTFRFKAFYIRRARRLFPALFATLAGSLIAATLLFSPERMQEFALSAIAATLSFSNVLFWLQHGYFDAASNLKPLLHTWSLSVEEQFYLLWPLTIVVLVRNRLSVVAALILLFATSLVANLIWREHSSAIFYLLPFRVFEFAIGALVIFAERRLARGNTASEVYVALGLAMIAVSYVIFDETSRFPSLLALLPCIGTALALLGGRARIGGLLLRNPLVVEIGKRSYSLYLVHWPIIVFYEYATLKPMGWKTALWLTALTLLLGWLMHAFAEQPFRKTAAQPQPWLPRAFVRSAVAAALCLIVLCGTAWQGWIWRLGPAAATYEGSEFNAEAIYGGAGCGNECDTLPGRPVSIFVMGDSHAQQYYAGFRQNFPNRNTRLFQWSSCPFFSVEYTRDFHDFPDPKAYDDGCRKMRKRAFDDIRNSGTDAVVIVSQFWVNFALISERSGQRHRTETIDYAFLASQIASLKAELGVNRLLVIGSVPGTSGIGSVLDCAARPFPHRFCDITDAGAQPQATRQAINAALASHLQGRAGFLNPFDALCDDKACRMLSGGLPVYSDPTHLTKWGSDTVVRSFRDKIGEAASSPGPRS